MIHGNKEILLPGVAIVKPPGSAPRPGGGGRLLQAAGGLFEFTQDVVHPIAKRGRARIGSDRLNEVDLCSLTAPTRP